MNATATTPICPGPLAWAGAAAAARSGCGRFARRPGSPARPARRGCRRCRRLDRLARSRTAFLRRRAASLPAPPASATIGSWPGSELSATAASIPDAGGADAGASPSPSPSPSFNTAVEPASSADDGAPGGTSISVSGDVASGDPPEIGGSISSGASAGAAWCDSAAEWESLTGVPSTDAGRRTRHALWAACVLRRWIVVSVRFVRGEIRPEADGTAS